MNYSTLVSNRPLSPLTNLSSFFKLPLIFVLFLSFLKFVVYRLVSIFIYSNDTDEKSSLLSSFAGITLSTFHNFLFYFSIAAVMFISCKLYEVNRRTILLVFIMVSLSILMSHIVGFFMFSPLYQLIETIVSYLDRVDYISQGKLREMDYSLYDYALFILMIIKLLLTMCIIKIIGSIRFLNKSTHFPISLKPKHQHILLALLFSALLLVIPAVILFQFLYYDISTLVEQSSRGNITTYLANLVAVFYIFTNIAFQFIINFFVIKDCFKREFTDIPINLLLKSVAWSYFYLLIVSVIFYAANSLYVFIADEFLFGGEILNIPLKILYILLSFIISIVLIRKIVKKYFWEDKLTISRVGKVKPF